LVRGESARCRNASSKPSIRAERSTAASARGIRTDACARNIDYERGELREASATSLSGKALDDAGARELAQSDAAADDAFVASLLALVAAHPPRCEPSVDKAIASLTRRSHLG
jgi:hypothetical protein